MQPPTPASCSQAGERTRLQWVQQQAQPKLELEPNQRFLQQFQYAQFRSHPLSFANHSTDWVRALELVQTPPLSVALRPRLYVADQELSWQHLAIQTS